MSRLSRGRTIAAWATVAALGTGISAAHADCTSLDASLRNALQAGDLAALTGVADQIAVEPTCDPSYRANVGARVALQYLAQAQRNVAAGQAWPAQEALLVEALRQGRPWQLLATLADLRHEARDFSEGTKLYQEALTAMADEQRTPTRPADADIARIKRLGEQSWALAATYQSPPLTRDGRLGGLALRNVRGFAIEPNLPVRFDFNSDRLTPDGQKAAADLLKFLSDEGSPKIRLLGHTDPVGSDEYNLSLSLRRAAAVQRFLASRGYKGAVEIEGRGKRQPLPVQELTDYTEAQRHSILRRVELRRVGG